MALPNLYNTGLCQFPVPTFESPGVIKSIFYFEAQNCKTWPNVLGGELEWAMEIWDFRYVTHSEFSNISSPHISCESNILNFNIGNHYYDSQDRLWFRPFGQFPKALKWCKAL